MMQQPVLGHRWSVAWWFMAAGSIVLALMHLWAQTVERYRTGLIPPEFGIYIGHSELDKMAAVILPLLLSVVWLFGLVVLVVYALVRRRALKHALLWQIGVLFVVLSVPFVPSSMWDEALVATVGPGKAGGRLLGYAAASGDIPRLRALLDKGVAVDATNAAGTTESSALVEAVRLHQYDAAKFLLEHGADPNHRAIIEKPLISAVRDRDIALVRLLLEHGADPCVTRVWFTGRGERNEVSVYVLANDEVRALLPPCQKPPRPEK